MQHAFLKVVAAVFLAGCMSNITLEYPALAQNDENAELTKLYEQDQADRKRGLPSGQSMAERDEQRRERVSAMLRAGEVNTAADYFRAAMIFQHGNDTTHFKKAHELAKKATELDPTHNTAKWLTAATWDRYLLAKGKPQWYGTQFAVIDGKWYIREIDTTHVSDANRQRLGVRTLDGIRAYLNEKNGTENTTLEPPKVNVVVE